MEYHVSHRLALFAEKNKKNARALVQVVSCPSLYPAVKL